MRISGLDFPFAFRRLIHCGLCAAIAFLLAATSAQALTLLGVQSRKDHLSGVGSLGVDVDFSKPLNGGITVEPRSIGTGHKLVFHFDGLITDKGNVSAIDESGTTLQGLTTNATGNDIIVFLVGLPDNKRVTITLDNINSTNISASASVGFLVGDVSNSGVVSAADISSVKARVRRPVNAVYARGDLDVSGAVDSRDVRAVKARAGNILRVATAVTPRLATTVTVDPAVPVALQQIITEVISPLGSGVLGGTLQIYKSVAGGDSMILALDASGNIAMGALATTNPTVLTADSTALAFVRLAFGVLPQGVTASQFASSIRATSAFSDLVTLISQSHANGVSPATSTRRSTSWPAPKGPQWVSRPVVTRSVSTTRCTSSTSPGCAPTC